MAASRRLILLVSSVILLFFIAISLATAIEAARPSPRFVRFRAAQMVRVGKVQDGQDEKVDINHSGFEQVIGGNLTASMAGDIPPPTATTPTETQEGMIGLMPVPQETANGNTEGVPEPVTTPSPSAKPAAPPAPVQAPGPRIPVMAISFAGSGGPKHCRGEILSKITFPPPLDQWKNGTCINLPKQARCGTFFSAKGDNCEARLYNMENCYNSSRTYVNTVVFMPEERPVGALWNSMFVKCGVEVPDAKMLDPSILGDALKKPGGG